MVNKVKNLYMQHKKNTLEAQKNLGAEDFDTIFNEYIPVRDDKVSPWI